MTTDELNTANAREIRNSLKPLFDEAEKKGLWFYSPYQSLWFSPKELRHKQAKGRFVWGEVNWELQNPSENLEYLQRQVNRANQELRDFIYRMAVNKFDE